MPAHLLYKANNASHNPKMALLLNFQIALYLEFLLNRILLDRLPSGSFETKQGLVDTARKMLDAILVL
jgi:hypothetical protein